MPNYVTSDFGESVQNLVDGAVGWVEEVKREASLEVVRRLYDRTPKDTTNASKAWLLSVGPAPSHIVFDGTAIRRNPVTEAFRELIRHPEGDVHITNDERYIHALEYGHSKQAPNGFLRITIAEWPAIVAATSAKASARIIK